jgi:hypothetical protein
MNPPLPRPEPSKLYRGTRSGSLQDQVLRGMRRRFVRPFQAGRLCPSISAVPPASLTHHMMDLRHRVIEHLHTGIGSRSHMYAYYGDATASPLRAWVNWFLSPRMHSRCIKVASGGHGDEAGLPSPFLNTHQLYTWS